MVCWYDDFRKRKHSENIFVVCIDKIQPYLSYVNYIYRSTLTRSRDSAKRYELETGSWHKPRAIPHHDIKYIACNTLDDEFHYMIECPLYKGIRKKYIIEINVKILSEISKYIV